MTEYLWTEEDRKQSMAMGWSLEPIMGLKPDAHAGLGSLLSPPETGTQIMGYALVWVDPRLMRFDLGTEPEITDFVASYAAAGVPLYEKAWLAYCYLEMQGRIVVRQ